MPTIKKILFPTSCSESSKKAFEYTLAIARRFGAEIDLLHICEPNMDILVPGILRHQLLQEQKQAAQRMLQNWLNEFEVEQVKVSQEVELGYAKEMIATYANQQKDLDLIVIGTKDSSSSFKKIIWGTIISTTIEAVVNVPVLVVPKGIVFQEIKNIAYVTPVNPAWQAVYPRVKEIAAAFKAKLYVTHLPQGKYDDVEGENHVVIEDYASALHAFSYNNNLHLLVTVASVRNTFQKILQYSKAQKMAFETIIPLLVLKKGASQG
ncbi:MULTISPECIES: universal stress protein [unclassified Aureispira]|uniref:universal stress protein n=1 Tax=unclassified Aureispira TaxID=2649989 RepID=UPI0006991C20|nr:MULTISPECIES: universal stress protein [unclassified Aureispira]WMX14182.1 universal stress protein [Aureispira sp. CCB-E]